MMPSTATGTTIGLLRDQAPETLLLPGGHTIAVAEWREHCRQEREYVLIATRDTPHGRMVQGSLELRILDGGTCPRQHVGRIDRLYVLPTQRRAGLGTRLIRAALAFGRARRLARLREHIPDILRWCPRRQMWCPHLPEGEAWGGLRSLGATVKACVAARQPCAVAGVTHHRREATQTIGAYLELPLGRPAKTNARAPRVYDDVDTCREAILDAIASDSTFAPANSGAA